MNYKKLFIKSFVFGILLISFFAISGQARASSDLTRWAWSNTIGWISFNCSNTSSCAQSNYKVTFSTSTPTLGTLSGYAWSDHVGWISFNSLHVSGCPVPVGGTCTAQIYTDTGIVTGWAKILTMGDDGWIKLSGTNHVSPNTNPTVGGLAGAGGVTYDQGRLIGFAYGNIGWIHFNVMTNETGCGGQGQPNCVPPAGTLSAQCTTPSNSVTSGSSVTYTGSSQGGVSPIQYKWGSEAYGNVNTKIFTNVTSSLIGPSLMVKDVNNETASATCQNVAVTGGPSSEFSLWFNNTANHTTSIKLKPNRTAVLNWDTSPVSSDIVSGSCIGTVSDSNESVTISGWSAPWENNAPNNSSDAKTVTMTQNGIYTFRLTCDKTVGGTVSSNNAIIRVSQSTIEER